MLLIILSLFTYYDLLSCYNYEKAKFDESLLMKQHHHNLLEIKNFINKAEQKFGEEKSVLRTDDHEPESIRDNELLDQSITNWWWDNTTSMEQLDWKTPQTFLLPLIRSRPSFPFSITPYTTELNNRHLKWDEIFPDQNIFIKSTVPGLRTDIKVSSTPKNPPLPKPSSKRQITKSKDQKFSGPKINSSISDNCSRPWHPKTPFLHNTSIRGHSSQRFGPTITLITPNEELKKIWLREITTYTPVELWFKTLVMQTGFSPSNNDTTSVSSALTYNFPPPANPAFQYGRTLSNAQALVLNKQLKNISKDQPPYILRQGTPLSQNPTEGDDHIFLTANTAAAKTSQFYMKGLGGIIHIRTETEKDEQKTKMNDVIPVELVSDVEMKTTPTTAEDIFFQELETAAPAPRKSRRFHSKARMRNRYYKSHKRQKKSQRHQNIEYGYRYPEYTNEDVYRKQKGKVEHRILRRTTEGQRRFSMNTPKPPKENKQYTDSTVYANSILQYYDHDTEDETFIKYIERMDEAVRNKAQKDKTSFYQYVKESLRQAESKKRAKRIKLKAELLRKIVEGSSYSDEEESLKKNLLQALQFENRISERDVARNNGDNVVN